MKVLYPYDTTPFVQLSIHEVVKTLFEAIMLVFLLVRPQGIAGSNVQEKA